jgi:hypothetical protein
MKAITKTLTLAVLGAGLIAGVIVLAMGLMGGSEETAQANTVAGIIVGLDMNPADNPANSCPNNCTDPAPAHGYCTTCATMGDYNEDGTTPTPGAGNCKDGTDNDGNGDIDCADPQCPCNLCDCTLGTIQRCVEVPTGGGVIQFDVFLDNLPAGDSILGFAYSIGGWPLPGILTAQTHSDPTVNLCEQPGSSSPLIDMSDSVPDNTAPHGVNIADMGAAEYNPPFTQGVLGRYSLNLTGVADGLYALTLSSVLLGNNSAQDLCTLYGCEIRDANATPTPYGQIAVGRACPQYADLEIKSQALVDREPDDPQVTGTCSGTPPGSINVSDHEWVCIQKVIHNIGDYGPANAILETTGVAPTGATVSYHCDGNEGHVWVDGDHKGPCTAGTVWEGGYILAQRQVLGLAVSVDEPLTEQWDVHCTEASEHTFEFDNYIFFALPTFIDPDDTNNHATTEYTVDCTSTADLQAGTVTVTTDPTPKAATGELFDVTVSVNAINNGLYAPVSGDVTFGLTVPADCTPTPANYKVENVWLPLGTTPVSHTWQDISCTSTGAHALGGSALVAVDQTHVSEKTTGNESNTGNGSITITSAADLQVLSWTFTDDRPAISGYQVRVVPGAGVDRTISSTEVLHNYGPYTPVHVDVVKTVSDANMDGGGDDCDIAPNSPATWKPTLPLSTDVQDSEDFDIDWLDAVKPPYSCTFTFNKTLTITDADVGDPTPESPTRQVEAIRDTDGDTVVDRYATGSEDAAGLGSCNDGLDNGPDGNTDIDDPDCTLRERDNCQDDDNPDQADRDNDGLGDACDLDSDNDGILDDGDKSGVIGDTPCVGGETEDCDDNCWLIKNAGQEDLDTDGIGNVCELDVDCNDLLELDDVIGILKYIVGLLDLSDVCPPPAGTINGPRGSADPGGIDISDGVAALQCLAGLPYENIVCPAYDNTHADGGGY